MTSLLALTTLSLLGYHLTFDAEMGAPSDMSQFINTFANGDTTLYNNHEAENYVGYDPTSTASPFSFANGAVSITASPNNTGNLPYTSGILETATNFTQSGGYFEIRAETPDVQGFWPAFWLLPSAYYPEIDILEQPNNTGTKDQYWTHTSTPSDSSGGFSATGVNLSKGYHRYGFLWTANTIQYVFDGQLIGWPHPTPPSMVGLQMYMIANLAVGGPGSWPGVPQAGASYTYTIDYIRAYSNDPTVPAVDQEPISSPDGVDTSPTLLPAAPPQPASVGTGLDTLALQVAEDAYQGDAQFTLTIDGMPRGGTFTAKAAHAFGQTQTFNILGNYGTAKHTVIVNFTNNYGDAGGDRNLYVAGATLNNVPIQNAVLNEYSGGPQSFGFDGRPVQPIVIGTGPDAFTIDVSNVPKAASALFTVMVDGVAQGGVQAAAAWHAYGQTQPVVVQGTFGPGAHTVALNFLDGAVSPTTTDPVDFYVDGVSYNGIAVNPGAAAMLLRGTYAIQIPAQQPDVLTLNLTDDYYQGDAQAEISVDGQVVGTTTVTAPNWGQQPQVVTYSGNWGGPGVAHVVRVAYINDAFLCGGQDRNLYVRGITLDGASITAQWLAMKRQGSANFNYPAPAGGAGWVQQAAAPVAPPSAAR